MTDTVALTDFPFRAYDKLRYCDTDRQGHVNNAVFATFLETGRTEILHDPSRALVEPGCAFVIARVALDYRAEVNWPGDVHIGTRIAKVGRSSITIEQGLFQNERCVATAETVVVQMDEATRRSSPMSEATKAHLLGIVSEPTT